MVTDYDLRILVHLDIEEGQGLITLIVAPTQKHPPKGLSIKFFKSLLEVDESCIDPPFLALSWVDLS